MEQPYVRETMAWRAIGVLVALVAAVALVALTRGRLWYQPDLRTKWGPVAAVVAGGPYLMAGGVAVAACHVYYTSRSVVAALLLFAVGCAVMWLPLSARPDTRYIEPGGTVVGAAVSGGCDVGRPWAMPGMEVVDPGAGAWDCVDLRSSRAGDGLTVGDT
jgi:hypothetical protein